MVKPLDLSVPRTLFGALFVGMVVGTAQLVVMIVFAAAGWVDGSTDAAFSDGDLLSWATTAGALVALPPLWVLAMGQSRVSVPACLGLRWVGYRHVFEALLAVAVLDFVTEYTWRTIGRDIVTPDMVDAYRTTDWLPSLWIGVALAAPFIEEVVFRGYLYSGLRPTRLRFAGTALFTSAVWASLHVQYELPEISVIFLVGLVLAWVRERSGSAIPCIFAHVASNAVAVGQTIHFATGGG